MYCIHEMTVYYAHFFVKTKRQKSLQIMIGVSINYHKVNINGLKVQYY